MKKITICTILLLFSLFSFAQSDINPVRWTTKVIETSASIYDITISATIDSPWHMYDQGPYEGGPNPTIFVFEPNPNVEFVGAIKANTAPTKVFDEMFRMKIGYFTTSADFTQRVKLLHGAIGATLKLNVEWMVCDENSCLPPSDQDITIKLGNPSSASVSNSVTPTLDLASGVSLPSTDYSESSELTGDVSITPTTVSSDSATLPSLWGSIIEAILWGFAALLTPCVFPMVPMTVSFFMKGSDNRAKGRLMASLYGICIIALYTLPIAIIIMVTRFLGGDSVTADIFNWLATHWVPNVIFFLVFMIFAASFFGAFELTMPSWLVNKSDSKADKGGIIGVFFMALTLVLVSFSCTGPIVGSVLIKSTSGEVWAPVITMFAFSAAFALPFTLFAFFPMLLKNLPKSGGWLNSVKIVLGFLELALGLKFLSVADQTYHWGLLDREIYLSLWIVIFSLLGLYLLGKLRFSHDSDNGTVTVPRLLMAIITFAFVVYMIPGMWGAPLRGLSGYMPPMHTQDFVSNSNSSSPLYPHSSSSAISNDANTEPVKYSDFLSLPHGLNGFFDYKQGAEYARKVGKPLFIDYTGHGCVNCREMEARVWSDPKVLELLSRDFVIVALYSDDKKTLPQSDWVTTSSGKVLKGLGKINADFAHKTFNINSQPYYMILNDAGTQLVPGRGYNLNISDFIRFLEDGVAAYKAEQ